jgi:hypothetical protein
MNTSNSDTNKLKLNNFEMKIINSSNNGLQFVNIDNANYVPIHHLEEYKIKLYNNKSVKCDATINIDGEDIGTWRINSFQPITIERPSDVERKFTYADEKSTEAKKSGMGQGNRDNGNLKIYKTVQFYIILSVSFYILNKV